MLVSGVLANIRSGSVSAIDLARRELLRVIETGAGAEGIATSPAGHEVWVTNRSADTVSVIDLATWQVTARLRAGREPDGMAWIPASPAPRKDD